MKRVKYRGEDMKIRVLDRTLNELRVEIEGEGHTFCNALQKALLENDAVEMASYDVPHPLVSSPIVYVRTKKRRSPEAALRKAAEKIRQRSRDFKETFEEALREWQQK